MPLFEENNGIVSVCPEAASIPEFNDLQESLLQFIYFTQDARSPYAGMLPLEREEVVLYDRITINHDQFRELLKTKAAKKAIEKYSLLSYSPNERLLAGAIGKIEEYLNFWKDTKITRANHDLVAQTLKNANDLIKIKDTLEKAVMQQKSSQNVGGKTISLFEDGMKKSTRNG